MDSNNIYKKTEQYVTALFTDNPKPNLVFHTIEHTRKVAERTKEIAGHYYVSEKDMLAVFVAAWFHDTGYLFTDPQHHEEKSVELMKVFMKQNEADEETLQKIEACILATKPPFKHDNLLEQILCDADTYHFGTKEFNETNKKVWEEYTNNGSVATEKEWAEKTLTLLQTHQYFTKYCKDLLSKRKKKNMKKIKKIMEEVDTTNAHLNINNMEKDKTGMMSKGIQTMLRLTSSNHFHLSDMADSKAHILITVNAIIISVIVSVLLRKLEEAPQFTIPTILFLVVAVTTIVLSIISTRPKVSGGTFTNQDILDKKTNLLFFGNFYKSSFEEYNVAMREMMKDTDYLYGSLIKDIYTLGTVLGRKYKLLRLAYNIFMVGIVVSVIAFGVAAFFYNSSGKGPAVSASPGSPF